MSTVHISCAVVLEHNAMHDWQHLLLQQNFTVIFAGSTKKFNATEI